METVTEINEMVVVKLDQFYSGNILMDDGVAFCVFSGYQVEIDVSEMNNITILHLIERFEEEILDIYGQIVEFYEAEDLLSVGEDIINTVFNRYVHQVCKRTLRQLKKVDDFQVRIDLLNQLLSDSKLHSDQITPQDNCIYHTKRNLFLAESKRSSKENKIFRFTIAKKVLEYLNHSSSEYTVRIELSDSNNKLLFHVMEGCYSGKAGVTEIRRSFTNNDFSIRVNLPSTTYNQLADLDGKLECYIRLLNDKDLEFAMCEI